MRSLYSIFVSLLLCISGYCQSSRSLLIEAEKNYRIKSYQKSTVLYQKAFKLKTGSYSDYYNAACSAALANRKNLALSWLNKSIDRGYINIGHFKNDSDLNSLHNSEEWKSLIVKLQTKVDSVEINYDKVLQRQLITIFDTDQKHRLRIDSLAKKYGFESREVQALWKVVEEQDSLNLQAVKAILDKHGWVGEDKVGGQASFALFLVIQHADLATQQKYLPLMREAVKAKKAESSALALLEDRVALGEGRRQLYGSQIGEDGKGKAYVMALYDPENVDKRRSKVGLPPLSEYVKRWGIVWNVSKYKRQLPLIERLDNIKR